MTMRLFWSTAAAAAILVAPVLLSAETPANPGRVRAPEAYGQVPLTFEANVGQTDPRVAFLSRGVGYALFLTPGEAVLSLRPSAPGAEAAGPNGGQARESLPPSVLRLKCRGADPSPRMIGLAPQTGRSNYFIGNDPSRWRTDVPHFGKVRYEAVYPGIDLVYYGRQSQLEFDFVVGPGADPQRIGLDFDGADRVGTDVQGDLIVHIGGGVLRQHKPVAYQERDGERQSVEAAYVVQGRRRVAFHLGDYDPSRPLVIDPVLVYSTYLGGSSLDAAQSIATDGPGNTYVTGWTQSTNFPTGHAIQGANAGGTDAFVTKLNPTGSALVYSTYFGGSSNDYGYGIAVNPSGNAYVTGYTQSTDFPTVNAIQGSNAGALDVFVAKLNVAGSALAYSTYLGGNSDDRAQAIALDRSVLWIDRACITGYTGSTNFPTVSPIQHGNAGGTDAFVAKLSGAGSALVYSTFLGGSGVDAGNGVAADGAGNVYVTGTTSSADFPTTNPIQAASAGSYDAFVTKLDAGGAAFVYSTYLGGSSSDSGRDIAVSSSGDAYVTGRTNSADFPTANPIQASNAGDDDAFVAKLSPGGTVLVYSTYLGGSVNDEGNAVAVNGSGVAHVAGSTASSNFPTVNPTQAANAGGFDAFVAKLNGAGSALVYSTYLGGSSSEEGACLAVDSVGKAYLAGITYSTNFPTANPIQGASAGGGFDSFVAKIDLDLIFEDGFEGP